MKMFERLPSLKPRGDVLVVARVEKKEDFRWRHNGYVIFSSSGNLMQRCDDFLGLEKSLGELGSDFEIVDEPYNFYHKGQRTRYVPLGPVSSRTLSWMLSWRYL